MNNFIQDEMKGRHQNNKHKHKTHRVTGEVLGFDPDAAPGPPSTARVRCFSVGRYGSVDDHVASVAPVYGTAPETSAMTSNAAPARTQFYRTVVRPISRP